MPKTTSSMATDRQARRHNPLAEEYSPTTPQLKQKVSSKKRKHAHPDDENEQQYLDSKASNRILRIGQDLVDEEGVRQEAAKPNPAFAFESVLDKAEIEDEAKTYEDEDEDDAWGDEDDKVEELEIDPNDQDIFNRFHPSAAPIDPSSLSLDAPSTRSNVEPPSDADGESTNLADLILSKIAAHEAATSSSSDPNHLPTTHPQDHPTNPTYEEEEDDEPLPPKVIQVYTQIGDLLSRHTSGPLPKPFKILPTLPTHQIPLLLSLTQPHNWTPHAHLASTRLFISSAPHVATPYLRDILLPTIRTDISLSPTKKLNVHLYSALKKSLYKPAAFFKGILFPLLSPDSLTTLESGPCTLREAHILSSVVARVSVPVLHSAAALLRLCDIAAEAFSTKAEDGGGGATNMFIRVLLEKRYALPYKVVDGLVFHFARFKALKTAAAKSVVGGQGAMEDVEDGSSSKQDRSRGSGAVRLPVLWHQSLLAFAQRYRNDITEDQREVLLDVVAAVGHREIGPEVRRELLEGRGRGIVDVERDGTFAGNGVAGGGGGIDGDDTMVMG